MLKSKPLSNYYFSNPKDHTLKCHHYNIIVDNESDIYLRMRINEEYLNFIKLNLDINIIVNINNIKVKKKNK